MGLGSVYYDLLNHLILDASINPTRASERDCAASHLAHSGVKDLVIYDRGYNAFWLYALHNKQGLAFCMRAKVNRGKEFKHFVESGKTQEIISLSPSPVSVQRCEEKGLSTAPLKLRLIRVELPGEVEVLITNLLDEKQYGAEYFKSLYHMRWGIEENYKRLKQWAEIENFSGKSALSVRQDFHAKIVSTNLTSLIAMGAQRQVEKRARKRRLNYQVNFAQALSKMKHTVVVLIQNAVAGIKDKIELTIRYVSLSCEAVREGRSYDRKVSAIKNRVHYSCYKSAW